MIPFKHGQLVQSENKFMFNDCTFYANFLGIPRGTHFDFICVEIEASGDYHMECGDGFVVLLTKHFYVRHI